MNLRNGFVVTKWVKARLKNYVYSLDVLEISMSTYMRYKTHLYLKRSLVTNSE